MGSQNYFPVEKPLTSFWLSQPDDFISYRSTPDLPREVDVVVIGSGYSGTAVAYHLLNENLNPPAVLMLEARNVCSGATGRNGGHLRPCSYRGHHSRLSNYGSVKSAEIINFEYDHIKALREVIVKENIDCDFVLTRGCDVSFEFKPSHDGFESYKSMMKNPFVKDEVKLDVQYFVDDEARRISQVEKTNLCLTYTAGSLWPYKLVVHLLKKLVLGKVNGVPSNNFNLQTNTPVLSNQKLSNGKFLVTTKRGDVLCNKLIVATNAYTPAIEPTFKNKIIPVKGVVTRIKHDEKKGALVPSQLPFTYGFRWKGYEGDYLINRPDGSIIVGGGGSKYCHPQFSNQFFNNVDDSKLLAGTEDYFNSAYMSTIFGPGCTWAQTSSKTDHIWSGIMGYSSDELPYVGEFPSCEGKYVLAGFHGHGMPQIWLSGKAIAECVLSGKSIEDVETKIPQLFFLTEERLESDHNPILNYMLGTPVFKDSKL